mgnify:CR=1 FL=1
MINRIITEEEAQKRLSSLCAKSEHSSGEANEKMIRWGLSPQSRSKVIAKLIDAKFIDDRIQFNHWGRRKIEIALRQKGVDPDTASEALDAVDDDEYLSILRPMIKAKEKTVTGASDYERAMKTIKWAMGRGFTIDLIRKCIDDIAADYDDE